MKRPTTTPTTSATRPTTMRVALFLFIIAGFEQWIRGCQERKFRYFSPSDLNGIRGALSCWDRGVVADGRAGADGGSDGGANHSGGIETAAMERGCSQDATQGGSGKGGVSGPAAGGDYDDGGLDRRTPADGQSG